MAAWLYQPVVFESSRAFDCMGFEPQQCEFYKEPWHDWYVADLMFALPTVAFFMCAIGVFVITYATSSLLKLSRKPPFRPWTRTFAAARYLSYRGFRIETLNWNSAPVGVLLLGAIGTVYFICMDLVPSPYYWPGSDTLWGNSPPLGTRSGWLALGCMPFLFATASKSNWISLVTGVPHEKLQVFHRWIAYAFLVLALMHTFPFIVWHIRNHDMVNQFWVSNTFEYWTGIVALLFQAWLTAASCGPIRDLGYEFFKAAHFFSAMVFMVVFFWHCGGTLTSWDYFVATAAVYVPCWAYPFLRTIFEYGTSQKATLFVEDNGFVRINVPANFRWQPGQHCFLRFRSFGLHALSAHPFTICSLPSTSPQKPSELIFYIRHRGGFTSRLYQLAMNRPGVQVPVLIDGPYGGIDNDKFFSCERLIVVAGGSGAGWMLPFIEQYLLYKSLSLNADTAQKSKTREDSNEHAVQSTFEGPRSLRIILATREIATCAWMRATSESLTSAYMHSAASSDIKIEVYFTNQTENLTKPIAEDGSGLERSGHSSLDGNAINSAYDSQESNGMMELQNELRGRPDLSMIVREEAEAATRSGQSIGVFLCGPHSMQNDVRNAVAAENLNIARKSKCQGMYLHLEHFSWA